MEDLHDRKLAHLIQGLQNVLQSQGHPAFTPNEIQALLQQGHTFEPKRIRYVRGPSRKCLEIAYEKLRKHPDWSLWTGFVFCNGAWSAHAWNLTPHMVLIEPNACERPELYYGMESLAGPKSLERRGLTMEQIRKFAAYTAQFVGLPQ